MRQIQFHEDILRRNERNLLAEHLLEHLLLYRERKAEHEAILRHKWLESEKAGYDIGFDLAMVSWQLKHRSRWCRERREKRRSFAFQI